MIQVGEHPNDDPSEAHETNKFLGFAGEGHRGKVIAISIDRKRAVVVAMTESFNPQDRIVWGGLYLIVEQAANEWPKATRKLGRAVTPDRENWKILK